MAVAVEDGLVVPVIKFADNKSISDISAEAKVWGEKAKTKKLLPPDMEGSTFTISNLGMFGIDEFTAIINQPNACILAVGGIRQTPIVSGGEIKVGQGSDWLEVVGCGMVHPNVLRNCGIDPDAWQGFAFGFGIDRLAMLKYGIPDLRDMFASDTRWLGHYGFSAFAAPNPASGLS